MAAEAKSEVLKLIPKLSELQLLDVTTEMKLKLSNKPRKDRKTALYNLLVRHITSEEIEDLEDEEQLAIFEKLHHKHTHKHTHTNTQDTHIVCYIHKLTQKPFLSVTSLKSLNL